MTARGAAVELAARRTVLRQTLVPACAILACVLVAAHAPAEIRAPVVIAFLCAVPGIALVGLLSPDSLELELALALALSVALSGLTALVLVYAHLWSPTAVVLIVAAVTLGGGLRDVGLGRRARPAIRWLLGALRTAPIAAWRRFVRSVPVATAAGARVGRRVGAGLSAAAAALPALARRAHVRRRTGVALAVLSDHLHRAGRRVRTVAAVRPPRAAVERPPVGRTAPPTASESSLQSFLLDELRRSARSQGSRRRRQPESLAELEPRELEDLLSWSSLQRFVTHRAVQQVVPELWFVDDLERRLRRTPIPRRTASGRTVHHVPRGVWITGVSQGRSVPVVWRVLEQDGRAKEWRTRLALEAIDALSGLGSYGAVVAAGPAHGSLSGFRRGLEERGLSYLLRVDAVTAARELAPDKPSRSAAEAREVVRERLADGAAIPTGPQPNRGARRMSDLVCVKGAQRLVLCEVAADGRMSAFWLSNLPAATAPERLAFLLRLAGRATIGRPADEPLLNALEGQVDSQGELERQLAGVALAHGLRTLGLSAAREGATEA